ncbi:hypothetical protein QQF64_018911 [Cirrhinus molitorella]|uniref:Uncharacterized protein n=1 Tax=Cirrhinus molitorella TaxID=172907 RepID=A0ABR3LFE8_9TELE
MESYHQDKLIVFNRPTISANAASDNGSKEPLGNVAQGCENVPSYVGYYCMNTDTPPKLSNSTRLHFNVVKFINQNQTQWQIISIISALINGFLLILLIGLLKVFVFGNRRSVERPHQLNADLQQIQVSEQHQDPQQLQYAEVDFSKLRRNIRSSQINSTYAALKPPKP